MTGPRGPNCEPNQLGPSFLNPLSAGRAATACAESPGGVVAARSLREVGLRPPRGAFL